MSWLGVVGQDAVVERFRRTIERGRLASTFLFVGPPGIGKRTFAMKLAQALFCERHAEEEFTACGVCPACVQVTSHSHPDLELVSRPKDKAFIPVDLLIGDREHRMREGLCHNLAMKPHSGRRKIAILDDADYLNQEGANCLLKTLEEPPQRALIILIGTSPQRQLPTIRSRSQVVRFSPLAVSTVESLLLENGLAADAPTAARLAAMSAGSLEQALELADEELWEFRRLLLSSLSDQRADSTELASAVSAFVTAAGKDAPSRRARLKQVVEFAADFYRQLIRQLLAATDTDDAQLNDAVQHAARWWPGGELAAGVCLERCLDCILHVDANANQATVIECWIDDLQLVAHGGQTSLTSLTTVGGLFGN